VWVSSLPPGANMTIMAQDGGTTGLWFLYLSPTGQPVFLSRHGTATDYYVSGPATVTLSAWNHVALVRKAGSFTIYVNGVGGSPIATPAPPDCAGPLCVGSRQAYDPLTGYVDELRISKVARYAGNFSPPTTPFAPADPRDANLAFLLNESGYEGSSHNHGSWTAADGIQINRGGYTGRGCFVFTDATTNRITFPAHTDYEFGTRDWTVEWWEHRLSATGCVISREDSPSGYTPFLFGYYTGGSSACYMSSTGNSWDMLGGGPDGGSFGACPLNTWTHYAIERYQGTTIWLYKNGVLINGKNISASIAPYASNNPLSIGNYANRGYGFHGYLDDLRITHYAKYGSGGFTPPTDMPI
jgi:hypothetical protein